MIHPLRQLALLFVLLACFTPVMAAPLQVQKVTDGAYALVGELGQRAPDNLGNNATFGVIVTGDSVVLVGPGGSFNGAKQIHKATQSITDKPVRLVINTGGQDHRWLGNGYFKARGARIVASATAVADQRARTTDQLITLNRLVGEKLMAGTEPAHAGETFENQLELEVGGALLGLRHTGTAHPPGDSFVWLPQKKVVFAGDIVYVERVLVVTAESRSRSWIKAFEEIAALKRCRRRRRPSSAAATRSCRPGYGPFLYDAAPDGHRRPRVRADSQTFPRHAPVRSPPSAFRRQVYSG